MNPWLFGLILILGSGCVQYDPPTVPRRAPVRADGVPGLGIGEQGDPSATAPRNKEGFVRVDQAEGPVSLRRVLDSVERQFPELAVARLEVEAAEARVLSSMGAFDPILGIDSKNKVSGYYENQIFDATLEQPLETGGIDVFGGYRFGLGRFGSYDGDIETNSLGEVFLGAKVPILRGAAIDKRRVNMWKARIARDAQDPKVRKLRLKLNRKAGVLYWKAVAAKEKLRVAEDLLNLARSRQQSLSEAVESGQTAPIVLVDNERLIAQRQSIVQAATRAFERWAIALSIYLRDEEGTPIRVRPDDIPGFPTVPLIEERDLDQHIVLGLQQRPELRLIEFERAKNDVELAMRENELLPKFNLSGFASQDLGSSTSSSRVDDQFEFGVGLSLEIPLRRRLARGRVAETRLKFAQLGHQSRLLADRIEGDLEPPVACMTHREARKARLRVSTRGARVSWPLGTPCTQREHRTDLRSGRSVRHSALLTRSERCPARSHELSGLVPERGLVLPLRMEGVVAHTGVYGSRIVSSSVGPVDEPNVAAQRKLVLGAGHGINDPGTSPAASVTVRPTRQSTSTLQTLRPRVTHTLSHRLRNTCNRIPQCMCLRPPLARFEICGQHHDTIQKLLRGIISRGASPQRQHERMILLGLRDLLQKIRQQAAPVTVHLLVSGKHDRVRGSFDTRPPVTLGQHHAKRKVRMRIAGVDLFGELASSDDGARKISR